MCQPHFILLGFHRSLRTVFLEGSTTQFGSKAQIISSQPFFTMVAIIAIRDVFCARARKVLGAKHVSNPEPKKGKPHICMIYFAGTPRCHHIPRNSSTIARHTALPPHASEQFYDCKAPAVVAVCDSDDTATWPTDMFSTKCAACCLRRAVGCDPAHALRLQDTAGQNDAWYGSHLPAPCAYRACQTRFGWPFSASSGAATSGLGRAGHVVVTYFYFSFGVLSC